MIESLLAPENLREILPILFALPTLLQFTSEIRQKIYDRDGGTCQICGKKNKDGWRVDAAHYDHSRKSDHYNDPDNGRILCLQCHFDTSPPQHQYLIQKRIDEQGLRWK